MYTAPGEPGAFSVLCSELVDAEVVRVIFWVELEGLPFLLEGRGRGVGVGGGQGVDEGVSIAEGVGDVAGKGVGCGEGGDGGG